MFVDLNITKNIYLSCRLFSCRWSDRCRGHYRRRLEADFSGRELFGVFYVFIGGYNINCYTDFNI